MDKKLINGCIFGNANWIVKPFKQEGIYKHNSDVLLMFIGANNIDPENLNAEIELWIENDELFLTRTCIVFIPAGVAYGNMEVRNITKPVFNYICHINTDTYEEIPAEATAATATYACNWVEKYDPVDGRLPAAPEGFLTRLLWIDDKKLSGAPYLESVWFNTPNDTGPEKHTHDFDEVLGFFGSGTGVSRRNLLRSGRKLDLARNIDQTLHHGHSNGRSGQHLGVLNRTDGFRG